MGREKGAIEVDGVPMLERVVTAAKEASMEVMVVGRERPQWWRLEDVEFIDEPDHRGPLSGLEAALLFAGEDLIAVACDMPRLSSAAFEWLDRASGESGPDGLVTLNGERPEPLFSFYRYESTWLIHELLSRDHRAMSELIERGRFQLEHAPAWLQAELHNVNRPEDLK
jgi:molybdopterin-guanine dinucleotide biosynthesis protein A